MIMFRHVIVMVEVESEMPSRVGVEVLPSVKWRQKFGACMKESQGEF
jgi:hypothetical protein